jgi:hypothetical protein
MTLMSDDKGNSIQIDYLTAMFAKQLAHKQEYDKIYRAKGLDPVSPGGWGNLNDPRLQLEIRTTFAYLTEELMEAIGLLKNKPWKQTPKETDPEAFYSEIADAWHFWLELMILIGMTPEMIVKYYFKEAQKNDTRRTEGY